ncbi:MAG: type II secretion system F family protein, partial [Bacilli bacterium]|nr:type II secretion system F family protein [Bacilli bacterium]
MAIFKYQAMTLEGKVIKGRESAGDLRDLQSLLKGRDLKLIKGREVKERKSISFLTIGGGVKKSEVIIFIRQFAVMITAGINIIDAIDTMRFQVKSKVFRNILIKIYDDLLKGVYLSDAFAAHPKVFPSFLKNMIYIGEVSGNLDYVLNKVADYYERDLKTKAKAKNALTYPTFLFVIIVAVFIFLTVYIVPEFQNMLKEFGGELPYLTQIVFNISNFMRGNFINILQYVGCAFVFLWIFFKTKPGRYVKDYLKLNLPFLRAINHTLITARFARGL